MERQQGAEPDGCGCTEVVRGDLRDPVSQQTSDERGAVSRGKAAGCPSKGATGGRSASGHLRSTKVAEVSKRDTGGNCGPQIMGIGKTPGDPYFMHIVCSVTGIQKHPF